MATAQPMDLVPPAPEPPPLAAAFLALSEGLDAPPPERLPALVALTALAASVVLALSGPLAWISGPTVRPSDLPPATQASKASVPTPDDDAGDG
jgi:hypothetical protein